MADMNNSDKQLYEWYIGLNFSAESFWQGWNIFRAFKLFPNHSRARYNPERFVCRVLSAHTVGLLCKHEGSAEEENNGYVVFKGTGPPDEYF